MSAHPVIPFDRALLDEIATSLDLRAPNAEALEAVAKRFDGAAGAPFEAVCDLATAVGKTYLAAGLIDYLATSGVRHILFVTPGRTILNKTLANFTPGHPKSVLGGMEWAPALVTADNFATGAVTAALGDDTHLKLFVFNVQQLIRPSASTSRRVRSYHEWLGTDLYQHLRDVEDLVVIADECHIYAENATAFHAAIRDLDAMATVGLTATPDASDAANIVYHYPLARAIADRFVKTPVLVGRKDEARDVETRLRDGLVLLDAKKRAADVYAEATGAKRVNPVMFVVAERIDDANAVNEALSKPSLLGDDYEQQVLVIHSEAPDDALARLEGVEDPDSPVRVIVSVSMLKEGWDCKNIFVVCSLRPSISEVLTEQTLGRGLRLPWGVYTEVELLDTVEVISHERYEELLARAGVLLEGLVDTRATEDEPATGEPPGSPGPSGSPEAPTPDGGLSRPSTDSRPGAAPASTEPGHPTITPLDERIDEATTEAAATSVLHPKRIIEMPKVIVEVVPRAGFNLSAVDDDDFEALGRQLADVGGDELRRKVLDIVEDASAPAGYRLVPREADEAITASAPQLPFGGAKARLAEAIFGLDIVSETRANRSAANRLAEAVVTGAGSEERLSSYFHTAVQAVRRLVHRSYKAVPPDRIPKVEPGTFAPGRVNSKPVEPNRFLEPFSRNVAYSGWRRSQFDLASFDSRPERTLANLLDDDGSVEVWTRIQRGELTVTWEGGRYTPDFYAEVDGVHYLLEVKADRDIGTEVVQAKAAAAKEWARFVTDDGDFGTWKYQLVSEEVLNSARTVRAVLNRSSHL